MKEANHTKYSFLLSYVDMLYAVLASIFSLFLLSFILLNVKKHNTGKVDTDAQLEIVMTWKPDGVANDIDLWCEPPTGVPIGWTLMQNSYMNLNRDDLGDTNDYAIINGKRVEIPGHREVVSIRKKVPGHYVVNAQFYADHTDRSTGKQLSGNVPVTINLTQVNPEYKVIVSQSFVLYRQGDEYTAFAFDIESDGTVDHVNTTEQVPFVLGVGARPMRNHGAM